jgi:FAD binding domain
MAVRDAAISVSKSGSDLFVRISSSRQRALTCGVRLAGMAESRRMQTSVIVVGGGPVGLALAASLGKAGIPCVLLERGREPSAIPSGQNRDGPQPGALLLQPSPDRGPRTEAGSSSSGLTST